MKVLIIDSSPQILERLEEIVSDIVAPASIFKASSYAEGTKLFEERKPDVVLLDLGLPANRSFDLIWEMKTLIPSTAIIVLSIHTDINTQQQCHELGADLFFDKYNEFEKLPAILSTISDHKNPKNENLNC